MEQGRLDTENYRNLLLFALPVTVCAFEVRQWKVKELIMEYALFNTHRQFVYFSKDAFHKSVKGKILDFMFDVKEQLVMQYGTGVYDMTIETFDLVGYVPFVNTAFVDFLDYFTHHKIVSVEPIASMDQLRVVYDETKVALLNRKSFDELINRLCILNYGSEREKDEEAITKTTAAEDFDERKRALEEKFGFEKRVDVTLNSTLSWLANDGYTHQQLAECTIYQVMDAVRRKNYISYCDLINQARSAGNCSMKPHELKKINFAYNLS